MIPTVIPATHVHCPLCLARPGQLCEQVVNGLITARPEPHPLRIRAAEEMAREIRAAGTALKSRYRRTQGGDPA